MANLFQSLKEYKEFKENPPKLGVLHGSLAGIRKKVLIPVPSTVNPSHRWTVLKLLLQLVWSGKAIGSVVTGAFLSLLTFFAETPASLLRTLIHDSDIEALIVDVVADKNGDFKFASRGLDMKEQEQRYKTIAAAGPNSITPADPFVNGKTFHSEMRTTDELQTAINSVTVQIWILLTKAVTAPDTAKESENRRWLKFVQQKRVDEKYQLKNMWLEIAREEISRDISIRRLMVDILVEIGRSTGARSRVLDMIMDIGGYIAEAGMAGFHLTIKYGIETRLPHLALNEFQSDLSTLINLMKLYKEQGDRAPYLVLLEDAVHNKFSPGGFSLLWSFAMGVGTTIDKQLAGLNFNRGFLEPNFFKLGQDAILKMEGNVDTKLAHEMGLTDEQISELKMLVRDENRGDQAIALKPRISGFQSRGAHEDDLGDMSSDSGSDDEGKPAPSDRPAPRRRAYTIESKKSTGSEDFHSKLAKIAKEFADKHSSKQDKNPPEVPSRASKPTQDKKQNPAVNFTQGTDIEVMDSM